MYNLSDITGIHFEPTSKCQARCAQCGRFDLNMESESFMKINPLITDRNGKSGCLDEVSLRDFIKWFPPKFIKQLDFLYMCGTTGEPTLATDCLKIFAYLRTFNPRMELTVHTNGGCKTKDWWRKLAKLKVRAVFGIDGLEDTHSLYRVNTKWREIIKSARAFIDAGGEAEWQMIVFKHNQHQIKSCKELAEKLGFSAFYYQHTTRFAEDDVEKQPVVNPKGEIMHYLEPSTLSARDYQKVRSSFHDATSTEEIIDCIAKNRGELYVAANGNVLPCCHMEGCFLYNLEDIEDYKKKIKVSYNLYKNNLKEIFDSLYFRKIQYTWDKNPLSICAKTCGKCTGTWTDNTENLTQYFTLKKTA